MRFCTECGTSLSEQAQFCKECGASVRPADGEKKSQEALPEDEIDPQRQGCSSLAEAQSESAVAVSIGTTASLSREAEVVAASVRMSRKQKIFILSGIFLLAALFGGYKVGEYFTSEERLIGRFEKALESKDHKAVAQLLTSKNKDLVIDEKSISGFMNYLGQHPGEQEEIINTLKEQTAAAEAKSAEEAQLIDVFGNLGLNSIVNLEKSGKVLFYDNYTLTIDGVYISVETNYAGTVFTVNGQQAAVANTPDYKTKLGPYVPGLYQLEARFNNEFIDLQEAKEVQLLYPKESYSAYFGLDGEVVRWDTRFSEQADLKGRLYVNGKKVEVNPFDNPEFGPVTMDGSMTLAVEADFPWGTMKSAEVPIKDDYIDLDFTMQESFQKTIKDTIIKHAKENLDAFASGDAGKLTVSTDNYKAVFQNVIDQFKDSGYAYKANYVGTVFDIGSFDLDLRGGKWYLTLITKPLIEAATYVEGASPFLEMQEAYSETGLLYDENQGNWRVDFIANTWGFKTEDLQEYKENKSVTYESTWNETAKEDSPAESVIKVTDGKL
ncbi:MAG: zinc ribbon domain-containing protein [Bacillota bacterium]